MHGTMDGWMVVVISQINFYFFSFLPNKHKGTSRKIKCKYNYKNKMVLNHPLLNI